VIALQNSARSKQCYTGRNSSLLTLLFVQPKSKSLIANDNPTRIVILSDQRESKGQFLRSLLSKLPPSGLPRLFWILIANLELEFRATIRKQTEEPKSNRKYFAIFYPAVRRGPSFLATRNSSLSPVFLIETPRLESHLTSTKQSTLQISNRDKIRVFQFSFVSQPLSSALNLAIIDFPTRGHL
jgi:hypothetical protein